MRTPRSPTGSAGGRSSSRGRGSRSRRESGHLRTVGVSARLTAYPADLLTHALADTSLAVRLSPGGALLAPVEIADATPLPGVGEVATASSPPEDPDTTGGPRDGRGAGVGRIRPGRGDRRRPAGHLPDRRCLAARPADLADDRGGIGGRPCPHARTRQDPDGGVPGRDAGDARPCRGTRVVGDGVAHARDPGPGGAHRRRGRDAVAGPRRAVGADRGGGLDPGDRRLDAGRRGPAPVACAASAARPGPPKGRRTTTTTRTTMGTVTITTITSRLARPTATAGSRTATSRRPGRRSPGGACSSWGWPAASSRRPARC